MFFYVFLSQTSTVHPEHIIPAMRCYDNPIAFDNKHTIAVMRCYDNLTTLGKQHIIQVMRCYDNPTTLDTDPVKKNFAPCASAPTDARGRTSAATDARTRVSAPTDARSLTQTVSSRGLHVVETVRVVIPSSFHTSCGGRSG